MHASNAKHLPYQLEFDSQVLSDDPAIEPVLEEEADQRALPRRTGQVWGFEAKSKDIWSPVFSWRGPGRIDVEYTSRRGLYGKGRVYLVEQVL